MHRVLVTASQDWVWEEPIYNALSAIRNRPLTVVHGGARGGDRIADRWARERQGDGVYPEPHARTAQEIRFGGLAALKWRNTFMVDLGAHLCLAFHLDDSEGTADCIRKAMEAEIPTLVLTRTSTSQPAAQVFAIGR